MHENEVVGIVVGLPLALAGTETEWTTEVRDFAERLAARTRLPVHLMDERMTSIEAEGAIRGLGLRKSRREDKARIDATAAAIILRNYLDWLDQDPE